jgi:hypothetical protein
MREPPRSAETDDQDLEDTMKRVMLGLMIAVLVLAGCEGGTGTSAKSSCSRSGRDNTCTVTLVSIDGALYRHEIRNDRFYGGTSNVDVAAEITVEEGAVRVWVQDREGNQTSVDVEPGQTAELNGAASLRVFSDERSFSVYFEPLDETQHAANVKAEIRYVSP